MSLTTGRGPLSQRPGGIFTLPLPEGLAYVEPFRRRVQGIVGGRAVIDTETAVLVHRSGEPPSYAFAAGDVGVADVTPLAELDGYVTVPWGAVEAWYEEEEQVFMHPRNPYHRVDCVRTTRRLRVELAGVVLVDTTETTGVYETSLEPRLYVSADLVRTELLTPSDLTTYCPYKGTASYWNVIADGAVVENVAWSYQDPLPESMMIRGMLGFDPDKASVAQDLPSPGDRFS